MDVEGWTEHWLQCDSKELEGGFSDLLSDKCELTGRWLVDFVVVVVAVICLFLIRKIEQKDRSA